MKAPSVELRLAPSATSFRPGETVTLLLHASTSTPAAVELQELEVEVAGIERVDTSWVSPSYRKGVTAINQDRRRVQRYVLRSMLLAATQGNFADSRTRSFVIRFALPAWLPPTFRGSAVRYSYFIDAKVRYMVHEGLLEQQHAQQEEESGEITEVPPDPIPRGEGKPASAHAKTSLHIWPASPEQAPAATERVGSALVAAAAAGPGPAWGPGGSESTAGSPGGFPEEELTIKCWEIGAGTAVQDALAHIARLGSKVAGGLTSEASTGDLLGAGLGMASPFERHLSMQNQLLTEARTPTKAPPFPPVPPPSTDRGAAQRGGGASLLAPLDETGTAPASAEHSLQSTPARPEAASWQPGATDSIERWGSSSSAAPTAQLIEAVTTLQRSYALRVGDHPLVRVSLFPPLEGALQPGSTIAGALEFTHLSAPEHGHPPAAASTSGAGDGAPPATPAAAPRCMQVLVLLETEESVQEEQRGSSKGSGVIRRVWDEQLEVTADVACSNFLFTLPPDSPATFSTPLVQLKWVLRFQFTASIPTAPGSSPLNGHIDQLTWTLPLTVVAP